MAPSKRRACSAAPSFRGRYLSPWSGLHAVHHHLPRISTAEGESWHDEPAPARVQACLRRLLV
eukprot:scaffold33786_cov32-Tisochrysis_lutea.AAC.3